MWNIIWRKWTENVHNATIVEAVIPAGSATDVPVLINRPEKKISDERYPGKEKPWGVRTVKKLYLQVL